MTARSPGAAVTRPLDRRPGAAVVVGGPGRCGVPVAPRLCTPLPLS